MSVKKVTFEEEDFFQFEAENYDKLTNNHNNRKKNSNSKSKCQKSGEKIVGSAPKPVFLASHIAGCARKWQGQDSVRQIGFDVNLRSNILKPVHGPF